MQCPRRVRLAPFLALVALAVLVSATTAEARKRERPPAAPRLTAPSTRIVRASAVSFAWTRRAPRLAYQLRLARDGRFTRVWNWQALTPQRRLVLAKGAWWVKVRARRRGSPTFGPWSRARRIVVAPATDVLPPTRPGALTAPRVAENDVDVAFGPSADEFGVTAYEVLANGAVRATTGTTRATVRDLACGTTYTIAARAVDGAGLRSAPSPVANVRTRPCTDVLAPTAPARVDVTSATDTQVALAWPAGTDPDGSVGGYVVTRDGVELGRPIGAGFVAQRLRPGTTYTFAVRTRDRAGHLSDAVALPVTTRAPIQATGPVHAFLLASTEQSYTDFRDNYEHIAVIHPTFFKVRIDGTLEGADDARIVDFAQERGVKVMPRVETQDVNIIHAVLSDPTVRARLLDAIASAAAEYGYDGINLDFESGLATDRLLFSTFVAELDARLAAQGQDLSVCVSATKRLTLVGRAGFYDYAAIARDADDVFVMAWNEHWATSPAGPLASVAWVTAVMEYARSIGRPEKFTIGTHLYGFDWPTGARGTPAEHPDVLATLAARGVAPGYDAVAHEPTATYTDDAGVVHRLYWADAASVVERFRLARDRGMRFGVWRLGREDQTLWDQPEVAP